MHCCAYSLLGTSLRASLHTPNASHCLAHFAARRYKRYKYMQHMSMASASWSSVQEIDCPINIVQNPSNTLCMYVPSGYCFPVLLLAVSVSVVLHCCQSCKPVWCHLPPPVLRLPLPRRGDAQGPPAEQAQKVSIL